MKRILIADDERHVIEGISQIVKRDLAGEFEVVASAFSGRDAIEKASALNPDIILMDVRMPGLSGLDAVNELRRRGSLAAIILVTAYERFDIARTAVALGVIDYLLKPVARDKLAASLRAAAAYHDRRNELEAREIEHREREERTRLFVEAAFLHGIMLGERFGDDLAGYCSVLGIQETFAVVAAAAFLPPPWFPDPEAEAQRLHKRFRANVHYKTKAFAGPLVAGHSLLLLPLADQTEGQEALRDLKAVLTEAHEEELAKGYFRLGFSTAKPLTEVATGWTEALHDLLDKGQGNGASRTTRDDKPFEDDDAFLEAMLGSSAEHARFALERLLEPLRNQPDPAMPDRYRIISLFCGIYRLLARRGNLDPAVAFHWFDMEDLRTAPNGQALDLAARARFSQLLGTIERKPRWSPTVAKAIVYVKENFGAQISLEQAAYSVGISPNRLSRLFCEETGNGFSDFLIDYRIERAKELLASPGASIKQVSTFCGYSDPNYFSRLFKKVTGVTPKAFSSVAAEAIDACP
jgi:two-component system response regulator YesN